MSVKELIRQEIERQLEYFKGKEDDAWDDSEQGDEDALWYQGHRKMCANLLTFIDSLPEEKPSEDLEEAAKEYATTHLRNNEFPTADSAFIAGAKWQKAKDDEETADLLTIVALDAGQRARESMTMPELTWKDIRKIVRIADEMLDDPEARVEYNNHNEEYYYEKVLEEYYDR